ncbi:hypothetical protein BGZ83_007375 [Gryganskiella cystojenkinii]|nr:hypothetical protein BGZ83_007375 [Gryganskiella cystojenkinii]
MTVIRIMRVTLGSPDAIVSSSHSRRFPLTSYATVVPASLPFTASIHVRSTMRSSNQVRHRAHVIHSIRIQWRPAALAAIFSVSVLVYWSFYAIEGLNQPLDQTWKSTWKLCLFTEGSGGGDQEFCANQFAEGNVPDHLLMMASEFLVSTTGIWIFVSCFKPSFVQEWRVVLRDWRKRGFQSRDPDPSTGQFVIP